MGPMGPLGRIRPRRPIPGKPMRHPEITEIVRRDGRYAYEAYEFVFEALNHTQQMVGRVPIGGERPGLEHHLSGKEILGGAVDLAREEVGFPAPTPFPPRGLRPPPEVRG